MADHLSPAMLRELRSLHRTGQLSDPADFGACGALWFHARDRVIGALARRGLIEDSAGDWAINDAGRAVLSDGLAGAEKTRGAA